MKFFIALAALAFVALATAQGTGFTLRSINKRKTYEFGSQYAAVVYNLRISGPGAVIQGIDTVDKEQKGEDGVEVLHIAHQVAKFLPKKLFDWYKNINHIHVVDSQLESLEGETLDGRIRYLHMDDNKLAKIPTDFFRESKDLELLSMDRNKLTALDSELFKDMPKLRWVSFAGNRIRTLPGDLFMANINIECLSFENNGMVSTGRGLVSKLDKLKGVSFDGNLCINVAYMKDTDIKGKLTKDLEAQCDGQCESKVELRDTILSLKDKIKMMSDEHPKCSSGKAEMDESDSHSRSSESSESDENEDRRNPAKRPCPYAQYHPMMSH